MRITTPEETNKNAYMSASHDNHGLMFMMYTEPQGPFIDWETFEFLMSIYIIERCTEAQMETYVEALKLCPLYRMSEIGAMGHHFLLSLTEISSCFLIDVNDKVEVITNLEMTRP